MPQPTCQDTFAAAQQRRRSYPLDAGAYKLREARHALLRMMETVDAIGDFLRKPKSVTQGATIGLCCTTDDKDYWLKTLPEQVAEKLGYDILPAVAALAAEENIAETDVVAELTSAQARSNQLLENCEAQQTRLKRGIKVEYAAIKSGCSDIYALLVDADRIAQRALDLVD